MPVFTSLNPEKCCPEDTGFCISDDGHTFNLPLLDLSDGSFDRPNIDGRIDQLGDDIGDSPPVNAWISSEYSQFLELPMFNGGKNGKHGSPFEQRGRIATAYIAYDCTNEIVCVSAHLDASFLKSNPLIQVDQLDDESWISFGENSDSAKLKESNADEFMYVGKPNDSRFIIGYEGCWSVDNINGIQSIVNNHVEVHFTNDGDTTSSGKPASNGEYVCLTPLCEPSRPSITSTPNAAPTVVSISLPL